MQYLVQRVLQFVICAAWWLHHFQTKMSGETWNAHHCTNSVWSALQWRIWTLWNPQCTLTSPRTAMIARNCLIVHLLLCAVCALSCSLHCAIMQFVFHLTHCAPCSGHTVQYAMCTVHDVQCAMCTRCNACCAHCAMCNVQCSLCTLCNVQCARCTLCSVQCAQSCSLFTI